MNEEDKMMDEENESQEYNQAGIEEAQERAYECAHNAVVAATSGDADGAKGALRILAWEIETILNKGHRSWTDSALTDHNSLGSCLGTASETQVI